MTDMAISVTSADFVRRFGSWQDRIANDPVFVTHHGRRRLVMLSVPRYDEMVAAADRCSDDDGAAGVRLEGLIGHIDAGFVAFDATFAIIDINPAACAYFGVSRTAAVHGASPDALPELEQPLVRTHLAHALAAGEAATFELAGATHPGQRLRFAVFPYGGGVACLFRNVTGDRAARVAEEASRVLRCALAADTRIGVARLTLRGTLCDVDERFSALAGFAAQALEGVRLTDILPRGRRVEAGEEIEAVLTGGAPHAFDSVLLVNNGGELPVRIALAPARGDYAVDGAAVVVTAL